MDFSKIETAVAKYYSEKILNHGANPRGVDWNSEESQVLRFDQLLKVTYGHLQKCSLLDYGCGYGALAKYLTDTGRNYDYMGYDISTDMVNWANTNLAAPNRNFTSHEKDLFQVDFIVASGIFNVKMDQEEKIWQQYIEDTLIKMNTLSFRGFAFNMLTTYSEPEKMRQDLFYGDPCYYFDFCKRNFTKEVALLHDYALYEFTVLVRKQL